MTAANSINVQSAGIVGFNGTSFDETSVAQYRVVLGGATSDTLAQVTGTGTAGQVLTSAGAAANPVWATPTAPFPWTDEAISFAAASENGYFVTATSIATLPASPNQGDTITFVNAGAGALGIVITANTGQTLTFGTTSSSVAGTATSNFDGDSITITYQSASSTWWGYAQQGTWTLA